MFFIARPPAVGQQPIVFKSRISQGIAAAFRSVLSGAIDAFVAEEDLQIEEYDPLYSTEQPTLEYMAIGDVPDLEYLIGQFSIADQLQFPEAIDEQFVRSLSSYAVMVDLTQTIKYYYFRHFSPGSVLRSGNPLSVFFANGILSAIDRAVFHFDERLDMFVTGNVAVIPIKMKHQFELDFPFRERYAQIAATAGAQLEATNLFDGIDQLIAACATDSRKAKKLAKIVSAGIAALDFDLLSEVAQDWGSSVTVDAANRRIIIEPRKYWEILKLLGDDYLESRLTTTKYEAPGKRRRA